MKIACRLMDPPGIGLVLMPDERHEIELRRLLGDGAAKISVEVEIVKLVQVEFGSPPGRKRWEI